MSPWRTAVGLGVGGSLPRSPGLSCSPRGSRVKAERGTSAVAAPPRPPAGRRVFCYKKTKTNKLKAAALICCKTCLWPGW